MLERWLEEIDNDDEDLVGSGTVELLPVAELKACVLADLDAEGLDAAVELDALADEETWRALLEAAGKETLDDLPAGCLEELRIGNAVATCEDKARELVDAFTVGLAVDVPCVFVFVWLLQSELHPSRSGMLAPAIRESVSTGSHGSHSFPYLPQ